MVIIDKGNFLAIPVFHKQLRKIIQIKNNRFNPEIHEMLEDSLGTPGRIQHLHEQKPVEVVSESPVIMVASEEASEVVTPETVVMEKEKPKKRGMPKGGWPKKAKK